MVDSTFFETVSVISSKIAEMFDKNENEASIDLSSRDISKFNSYLEELLIESLDQDDYEVSSYLSENNFIVIQIEDSLFIINYFNSNSITIKKVDENDNNDYNNHISTISKEVNNILASAESSASIEIENPHFNLCDTHAVCESLKTVLDISDISCTNYRWMDKYEFIMKIGQNHIKVSYEKASVMNSENTKVYILKQTY